MALEIQFLINDKATPEIKKFKQQLDQLKPKITETDKAFLGMNKNLVALGATYLSVSKAIDLSKAFIRNADAMTLVNSRLKLATNSTQELVTAQKELFKISQEARTGLTQSVDLFERVTRSTRDYAISQKEVLDLTETINKAMIISGGTAESMNASIIQLGQAFSADFQAVGQELASIREQTPRLYQALLEGTGKTSKEFKKLAEDGKLSTKIIIDALKSQADAVGTEFLKINKTVDQSLTQVDNSMLQLIGNIDDVTGATSSLSDVFTGFSGILDGLNIKLTDYADNIENIHDIHSLSTLKDAERELQQLKKAYTENINEGVGFFESAVNYNAEIKTQEFLITSLIKKISRLTKEEEKLKEETKEVAKAFSDFNIDLSGFDTLEEALFDARALNVEAEKFAQSFVDGFSSTKTDAQFEAWVKERTKQFSDGLGETDLVKWEDTFASSTSNALVDALQSGDVKGALEGLGASISASMIQSSVANISSGAGSLGSLALGGGGGLLLGAGLSLASGLFGGSGLSSEEKAQKSFNKFIDGLDEASKAAEAFGNIGESVENKINSLRDEIARQQDISSYQKEFAQQFGRDATSKSRKADKQIELLTEELSKYNLQIDVQKVNLEDELRILKELDPIRKQQLERELEYKSGLSESNRLLMERIDTERDSQEALRLETEKAKQISDQNESLNTQLRLLEAKTDAERLEITRGLELDLIKDASNKKILEQIFIQQDLNAQIAKNNALEEERYLKFKTTQESLQQELDLLTGVTTQRDLELSVLYGSNKALQESIFAEQDRQTALIETNRITAEATAEQNRLNEAIANERVQLQAELFKLTATENELREDQISKLDESNQSIQRSIFAEIDKQKAQELAIKQAQEAQRQAQQRADDNRRLQEDLAKEREREAEELQRIADNFIDTMHDMSMSIDDAVDSIKGNFLTTDELSRDQIVRLNETQRAFESSLAGGDTESSKELLAEITSLSTGISAGAFGDSSKINQNLITSLEANKAMIDFSDEIIDVRIVSSEIAEPRTITTSTTPSVYVTNSTTSSNDMIEALLVELIKNNKNMYAILAEIQKNGVKTKV